MKKKIIDIVKECENEMNLLSSQTVCFTGHRSQKLPWKFNEDDERCVNMKNLVKSLIEKAINNGYKYFISGMALGFDMICAEIVIQLKEKHKDIELIAALPCKNQYKLWGKEQILRYKKILSKADKIRCIHSHYVEGCMLERNNYMLNNSSLVIALFDGKRGGTQYTINRAKKKGLKVEIIKP